MVKTSQNGFKLLYKYYDYLMHRLKNQGLRVHILHFWGLMWPLKRPPHTRKRLKALVWVGVKVLKVLLQYCQNFSLVQLPPSPLFFFLKVRYTHLSSKSLNQKPKTSMVNPRGQDLLLFLYYAIFDYQRDSNIRPFEWAG